MTCREKLQIEHPELVDDNYHGGCAGCPHLYGYLDKPKNCFFSSSGKKCTNCWDREIPEVKVNTVELLYSNLRKQFNKLSSSILGKNYYNMGLDVYSTDENTCDDILKTYKELEKERDMCKKAFRYSIISMLVLAIIVFFVVS